MSTLEKLKSIKITEKVRVIKQRLKNRIWSSCRLVKQFIILKKHFVCFVILVFLPFIPLRDFDLPILETANNARDILVTITQSLAQVFGIVGAIVLITLQIQKRTFGGYALREFFSQGILRDAVWIYLLSIFYVLLAIEFLSSPINVANKIFTVISIILFGYCIYFLIPLVKTILNSSEAKSQVKTLLDKVTLQHVLALSHSYRGSLDTQYIEFVEKNPIVIVAEAATFSLKEGDRIATHYVISQSRESLIFKLEHGYYHRETINAFIYIFRSISRQALEQNDSGTLSLIVDVIYNIYSYAATKQFTWDELIELNEYLEQLLVDCVYKELDHIVQKGIYSLQNIFKEQLEQNCPKPEELWEMYGGTIKTEEKNSNKDSVDKDLQWDHLDSEYFSILSTITEAAINNRRYKLISLCLRSFATMSDEVIGMTNLNEKMKSRITSWGYYHASKYTIDTIEEGVWKKLKVPFPFSEYNIDRALDSGEIYYKQMILDYSDLIIEVARRQALTSFELNQYAAFGRGLCRKVSNDKRYHQALRLVINTLEELRNTIEDDKTFYGREMYPEVYSQAQSIKKWLNDLQKGDSLSNEVEKILKKIKPLKAKKKQKHINDWPEKYN